MIIDLDDLLTKGCFGEVCFGSSREEVINLMGKPQAWDHQKRYQKAWIWRYGSVEFGFSDNNEVNFIGVYFSKDSVFPPEATPVGYFPSSHTDFEQFANHIRENDIEFQIMPELTFGNQICLLISDFGHVLFNKITRKIESIQLVESLLQSFSKVE